MRPMGPMHGSVVVSLPLSVTICKLATWSRLHRVALILSLGVLAQKKIVRYFRFDFTVAHIFETLFS